MPRPRGCEICVVGACEGRGGGRTALLALAGFEPYPKTMRWEDYITVTPGVRSGKPCIVGTRITVSDVLEYLAGGITEAEILAEFPSLRAEHIRAALAFAAARERRLAAPPAA